MRWLAESPARNLVFGLVYMVVVVAGATAAYVADGWSWGDAFYFVIITVFTVGYGELHPVATFDLRFITIATIILGCTGIIFLTGALVQFITIAQIQLLLGTKRMKTQIEKMAGHVIICGYGRIGQMLADELKAGGTEFVVLELNEQRFHESVAAGNLTVRGDATDETVLHSVGIAKARALASVVPNDAANVFITLSARNLNKQLEIIARSEAPSTKSKLLQAGANSVVEPTHIGAERIAQLIIFPRTSSFTDGSDRMRTLGMGLRTLGLDLEVMAVAADSPLAGATIETAEHQASGSVFVIAVNRKNGETLTRPDPATIIEAGDGVVVITRSGRSTPKIS
ncbi:MAG: potassium channel protein [Acidocella sp. 20-57-95]|nr:MAG: potassium channel protein [Acidocella sp. 20-57-95]OYV60128.1 MAG: potassium channel protein [Acidocella sp. 21-58-7]